MQMIYLIEEENHGMIGVAKDYQSAIDFLVNENWLDENFEVWVDELDEDYITQSIKDKFGKDWKEIISTWDAGQFNNFFEGNFYLNIKEVYGA